MAQSLKEEIQTWASALEAYDAQDWDSSLDQFSKIADNSKILTNIGLIYASLGEHDLAIENFNAAVELDNYLAIAYFQAGVSHFLIGQFEAALQVFEEAWEFMRGNEAINYEQLGLKYQLYSCSILFNQGITFLNLGDFDRGMEFLREAAKNKVIPDHDVIDEAIQENGDGYTVFSIPVGVLYRPNEKKVANMGTKDYMGKAKLISATPVSSEEFVAPKRSNTIVRSNTTRRIAFDDDLTQASLARSRSATVPTAPQNQAALGRSASAGNPVVPAARKSPPSPPPDMPLPAIPAEPLNLTRNKSTRIAPVPARPESPVNLPYASPQDARPVGGGLPPQRRPTLKAITKVDLPPTPPRSDSPAQLSRAPTSRYGEAGLTDIYDGYMQGSEAESRVPPRPVAAKLLANIAPQPTPARPRQAERKSSATSSSGGSGSYETDRENTARLMAFDFEQPLRKLRIKIHFGKEVRGMVVAPDMPLTDFLASVCAKFSYEFGALSVKFEDEDGSKVSLVDEGDWDLAIETARNMNDNESSISGSTRPRPGEGRLKIWCEEYA
ncbi:hypothetical protein M407DRAFT_242309 [Tulasnella calospora MUT 4182]|uniref:PB1 domain-containing protein n=1 Tax=Tulasnella calospora MUT 4182 TaxID=1051891 RepID=A0A0C3L8D8_9AGAM|nr:hypothetical protein M407DRAFT_242309 [Tulasnella calospora MUT 4182]